MPSFCAVVGCGSRGNRDKKSFFSIPCIPIRGRPEMIALKTERRMRWILALRRKDLTESKLRNETICDRHFIFGRPAATRDINNPDWVPTQNMGYETKPSSSTHGNQTTTKAIICHLTPCVLQQVQEERTESERIYRDPDGHSRIESSSGLMAEQYKKMEKKSDAIILYIKKRNPEQSQAGRTRNQEQQIHLPEQMSISIKHNNHQVLVKRTIREVVNEIRDSKKLRENADIMYS